MISVPGSRAPIRLGHTNILIHPLGLGCMGMSESYGDADRTESVATIREAIDLGVGMLDTSDIYGAARAGRGDAWFGHNETLIGEAIRGRRDEVVLATKFGAVSLPQGGGATYNGTPAYARQACEASLRRLGTDRIDLYYYHRVDPQVPIEETVGAMGELVNAGKVRAIGLSEVTPEQLERAARTYPIAALQSEYSLWHRAVEAEILPACEALGTILVAYCPLGRAMLTGAISDTGSLSQDDFRRTIPKFTGDNLARNLVLVRQLEAFANARHATAGQIALAWLLAQPATIAPIPGTKRRLFLRENMQAANIVLSPEEVAALSAIFRPEVVAGARYAWGGKPS